MICIIVVADIFAFVEIVSLYDRLGLMLVFALLLVLESFVLALCFLILEVHTHALRLKGLHQASADRDDLLKRMNERAELCRKSRNLPGENAEKENKPEPDT